MVYVCQIAELDHGGNTVTKAALEYDPVKKKRLDFSSPVPGHIARYPDKEMFRVAIQGYPAIDLPSPNRIIPSACLFPWLIDGIPLENKPRYRVTISQQPPMFIVVQ